MQLCKKSARYLKRCKVQLRKPGVATPRFVRRGLFFNVLFGFALAIIVSEIMEVFDVMLAIREKLENSTIFAPRGNNFLSVRKLPRQFRNHF